MKLDDHLITIILILAVTVFSGCTVYYEHIDKRSYHVEVDARNNHVRVTDE